MKTTTNYLLFTVLSLALFVASCGGKDGSMDFEEDKLLVFQYNEAKDNFRVLSYLDKNSLSRKMKSDDLIKSLECFINDITVDLKHRYGLEFDVTSYCSDCQKS